MGCCCSKAKNTCKQPIQSSIIVDIEDFQDSMNIIDYDNDYEPPILQNTE